MSAAMETNTQKRPPKPKKVETVAELTEKVSRARGIFFTEYKGLTVAEMTDLRRQCHQSRVDYVVCKNTFARMVLKDQGFDYALKHAVGPTGIVFGFDDPSVAAKILWDYAGKNEKLVLKGGIFEGKPISKNDIEAIKDLPSHEQAIALLLAVVQSPLQGFVNVLSAVLRDFVSVVDQIAQKKEPAAA
jgi:large subunit ribosomal protein L10